MVRTEETTTFLIRLPNDVLSWVEQEAARSLASRNSEIVRALTQRMDAEQPELAKYATKTRLKPAHAERVIQIGIGRHHFGDHPDATLVALADHVDEYPDESWHKKAVAGLLEREPKTDESASAIVNEIKEAEE